MFCCPPEKPLLVSSSESENAERRTMDKRKRAHSLSEDADSDSELKQLKPAKTPKKVQKAVSGFFSVSAVHSSADNGQSSASPTTFNVVVEVYRFGHTKCHYKRHTIVCSSLLNKSLNDFKKVLPRILRFGRGCHTGQHWVI